MDFYNAHHASPDTIPLALCVLFRYRVASSSTSQHENKRKYEYAISGKGGSELITVPVAYPIFRPDYRPQMSDAMLVAIAVRTAYKFLAHYSVNLQRWALPLGLSRPSLLEGERIFLKAIDYAVCIRQEEYLQTKGRLDTLCEEVFNNAVRPSPPEVVTKRLRTKEDRSS